MASNGVPSWSTTAASNVLANTGVNWDEGQPPSTVNDSARQILADIALWFANFGHGLVENLSFTASVGSNALTIALKRRDGSDPTAVNPVRVAFRNVTPATGDYSILSVTAATSIVISSGSTLGIANAYGRIWIVGFNDAGTFRLGVINCVSGTSIYPLAGWGIASSTAEGGAGAADSAQVIYTGTAVSSKPYTILGYVTYESGLTPGTYAAVPTRVQIYGPDVPLPGQTIQTQRTQTGAVATGVTALPLDDTIPQSGEGDQYMSQAITPTSAADLLRIDVVATLSHSANTGLSSAIFQDVTANALAAMRTESRATDNSMNLGFSHCMIAGTSSATTIKFRAGGAAGATTTFNGAAGARQFGGVLASSLTVIEVMA